MFQLKPKSIHFTQGFPEYLNVTVTKTEITISNVGNLRYYRGKQMTNVASPNSIYCQCLNTLNYPYMTTSSTISVKWTYFIAFLGLLDASVSSAAGWESVRWDTSWCTDTHHGSCFYHPQNQRLTSCRLAGVCSKTDLHEQVTVKSWWA